MNEIEKRLSAETRGPSGRGVDQVPAAVMLGHGGLVPVFTVVQSSISSGTVHCAEIKGIFRALK